MAAGKKQSKYATAGVDIDKGNKAVAKIKEMVSQLGMKEIGKFSGFFPLKENLKNKIINIKLRHDTTDKAILYNHAYISVLKKG